MWSISPLYFFLNEYFPYFLVYFSYLLALFLVLNVGGVKNKRGVFGSTVEVYSNQHPVWGVVGSTLGLRICFIHFHRIVKTRNNETLLNFFFSNIYT